VAQFTHERIRAFAAETPTVYRVAHDPETPLAWATAAPSLLAFEDGRMNARETGLMTGAVLGGTAQIPSADPLELASPHAGPRVEAS
jgi:hypothetical protein